MLTKTNRDEYQRFLGIFVEKYSDYTETEIRMDGKTTITINRGRDAYAMVEHDSNNPEPTFWINQALWSLWEI